jgi:asparagine synthase (glutamine-hydrolysing)
MAEAIVHRGPDAFYYQIVGNRHSLGGAKLHITGDKDAPFPYTSQNGGVQVLLNGEIYNYRDWQKKLAVEGYRFTAGTDTEVVWALYHKFGQDFVRNLKGMFAIALLDGNRLILARDPMGIKPLYYCRRGTQLVFASEIKSILRWTCMQPNIRIPALQEIITFGYIYSRRDTLFEGIKQVEPGELIIFDGQNLDTKSYFTLKPAFSSPDSGEEEYQNTKTFLSKLLSSCMKSILDHDNYKKGIFLSGGIDSTLMSVLAKEATEKITTFTLADSPDAPDLTWSRRVAKSIDSEHYEFQVSLQEYLSELPRFIYHYENIMTGGVFDMQGSMAFHLLCQNASQLVRVAITGEGADELFGGYYWTYSHPLGFADRIRVRLKRATSLVPNEKLVKEINKLFPLPEEEMVYRLNIFDALLKGGLSNYHLCSVDRSCGAFGFEVRPFYLHDDIVSIALKMPVEYKVPSRQATKVILKDVAKTYFSRYGLEEVADRDKLGMPSALARLDSQIHAFADRNISERYCQCHPFKHFLMDKMDVLLFDLFFYTFIYNCGIFDPAFKLEEALAGGIFENMYN